MSSPGGGGGGRKRSSSSPDPQPSKLPRISSTPPPARLPPPVAAGARVPRAVMSATGARPSSARSSTGSPRTVLSGGVAAASSRGGPSGSSTFGGLGRPAGIGGSGAGGGGSSHSAASAAVRHRERSPGGRMWERSPSPTRPIAGFRSRRDAAGYENPAHSHGNMLPHWRAAAVSPVPAGSTATHRQHLMDPGRRFRTHSPGGTDTGIIRGHAQGVLGHHPSASAHWNAGGHRQSQHDNREHNRQTSTYHGIESRARSDASGSSEPRYLSPRPGMGSHPSHYDRSHAGHPGRVPWHTYHLVPSAAVAPASAQSVHAVRPLPPSGGASDSGSGSGGAGGSGSAGSIGSGARSAFSRPSPRSPRGSG